MRARSEWLGGTGGGGIDDKDDGATEADGGDACDLTPFNCGRVIMCIGWDRPSKGPVADTGVMGVAGDRLRIGSEPVLP